MEVLVRRQRIMRFREGSKVTDEITHTWVREVEELGRGRFPG